MKFILLFCFVVCGTSFLVDRQSPLRAIRRGSATTETTKAKAWNPFKDVSDMMANFDDVIDDFVNKRMGNGEIFYGQRKYKPSGRENTTGQYNGMGMSDKTKIDVARKYKEEMMEMRRLREQGLKRD